MKTHHPLLPETFPERRAMSFGQDNFGIWQGVAVGDCDVRFRWIPPGRFLMGSPEDERERENEGGPQHPVIFKQGFWLAETVCTQALWLEVMQKNPSQFKEDLQNPVENIDWAMALEFIKVLNQRELTFNFRLPSEAEWEYACRADTTTPFWFGNNLTSDKANYDGRAGYANETQGDFRKKTVVVKSFPANPWGLYQMHGNVWEWCQDSWHGSYTGAPDDGSAWVEGESFWHVSRGGSWFDYGGNLLSAYRGRGSFNLIFNGFRLALGPEISSQAELSRQ